MKFRKHEKMSGDIHEVLSHNKFNQNQWNGLVPRAYDANTYIVLFFEHM